MQRFEIITEADARRLPAGSTVELLPGGHITPLARDTLGDRRITVVEAGAAGAGPAFIAPVDSPRRLIVGSDHTGVALRAHLAAWLRRRGLSADETGAGAADQPADYPDVAAAVARAVGRGQADAGIVIDGAGLGSAMAANKVAGVRAAMCTTPTLARYAREHNGANVLALGATLVTPADAEAIVDAFLTARLTEPRYLARLVKLHRLEPR